MVTKSVAFSTTSTIVEVGHRRGASQTHDPPMCIALSEALPSRFSIRVAAKGAMSDSSALNFIRIPHSKVLGVLSVLFCIERHCDKLPEYGLRRLVRLAV